MSLVGANAGNCGALAAVAATGGSGFAPSCHGAVPWVAHMLGCVVLLEEVVSLICVLCMLAVLCVAVRRVFWKGHCTLILVSL